MLGSEFFTVGPMRISVKVLTCIVTALLFNLITGMIANTLSA